MPGSQSLATLRRCPLCAGLAHAPLRGRHLRCRLCALGFDPDGPDSVALAAYAAGRGVHLFPNWNSWRRRLGAGPPLTGDSPCFAPLSVHMLAARDWHAVRALDSRLPGLPVFAPWPFGETLRARLGPCAGSGPALTLGVIASTDAEPDLIQLGTELAGHVREMVVALDTAHSGAASAMAARLAASGVPARVLAHELAEDFGAQRNRVQAAARTEWVLQLDCDERLTARTLARLPAILAEADRQGWAAIALPRRNLVDGAISALYPDVQYRLLRRSVRYTRRVHEYPELRRGERSFVHLGGAILHRLDSARFGRREATYERIMPGAGRPSDGALLRRPLGLSLPEA